MKLDKEIRESIEIDGVSYKFMPSNFIAAKGHAAKLLSLLKGAINYKDEDFDIDIGEILSNIGSKETEATELFILNHVEVQEDGENFLIKDTSSINKHFGKHPSHYIQVIFEGAKYHFLPISPPGLWS